MLLLPEDEPPLAPPGAVGVWVDDEPPVEPDEPEDEPPMLPLLEPEEGLELDDVPPVALDFWLASHSERDSLPSWSLSSLSNCEDEELEDDEPPAADEDELEGEDEELPPAAEGEDDLLPCDIEGEALESEELLELSAA